MPSINLYAELLYNIKQITFYASLETSRDENTQIDISSDRKIITVAHDGEKAHLYLPMEVAGTAAVTIPSSKVKDVSVRLEIADTSNEVAPHLEEVDEDGPWPAKALNPRSRIRCQVCKNPLSGTGISFHWKDLPSENWAEMMDFWHCHKPHTDQHHESESQDAATSKGYGATSRIQASSGVVLVDCSTFLMARDDCPGAKVGSTILFDIYFSSPFLGYQRRRPLLSAQQEKFPMSWSPIQMPNIKSIPKGVQRSAVSIHPLSSHSVGRLTEELFLW